MAVDLDSVLRDLTEDNFFRGPVTVHSRQFGGDGDTPLHIAVLREEASFVEILLQAGAVPNARGDLEKTPLHFAAWSERQDIAQMLLDASASIYVACELNLTPLDVCKTDEMRKLFLRYRK